MLPKRTSLWEVTQESVHSSTRSAVGKVMAVVEQLASARKSLSVAELSLALGLSRAQAHRIASTLEAQGILARHPKTNRLIFGGRLARLGLRIIAGSPIQPLWHVVLQTVADEIGETCSLLVFKHAAPTYFDRVEVRSPLALHFQIGSKVPLHCSAGGKLYLSQLPRKQRADLVSVLSLRAYTSRTITDPNMLLAHLDMLAQEGIGVDDEELVAGMVAIAVPVWSIDGCLLAALAVHAPSARLPIENIRALVPRLKHAAADLSIILEQVA